MSSRDELLVLGGPDALAVLDGREEELIELVDRAYRTHGRGQSSLPHSIFLRFPGTEVVDATAASASEFATVLSDADALLVRSRTRVDRALLTAARRLRVVGRAGNGVDNIDLVAASERGILVVNAPSGNLLSAVEHTFALLFAVARNVPQACAALRQGQWDCKRRDRRPGTGGRRATAGRDRRHIRTISGNNPAHDQPWESLDAEERTTTEFQELRAEAGRPGGERAGNHGAGHPRRTTAGHRGRRRRPGRPRLGEGESSPAG